MESAFINPVVYVVIAGMFFAVMNSLTASITASINRHPGKFGLLIVLALFFGLLLMTFPIILESFRSTMCR